MVRYNTLKNNLINSDKIFDIFVIVLLSIVFIISFYPLYFVIIASISDPDFINRGEVILIPKNISFNAYKTVFMDSRIITGYKNTIIYTVFATVLSVVITVFAAFPLSRKDMLGKKFFIWFFLFTMYFKGGLIPTYIQVKNLGLDSRLAVIILGCVGIWNLVIARTFFSTSIPDELWEASLIDGCNMYNFFFKIVLPNSKAIIAILVLYYAVGQWNDFFKALIYLNKMSHYPLQLILRDILLAGESLSTDVDPEAIREMVKQGEIMKYVMIIVSSLPVIALYPFVQKYFIKGVMVGSLKG